MGWKRSHLMRLTIAGSTLLTAVALALPGASAGRTADLPWHHPSCRGKFEGKRCVDKREDASSCGSLENRFSACPSGVWWDEEALAQGYSTANFAQMEAFFDKLNRGEPITMLVFGTSISLHYGGYFHSSIEYLVEKVNPPTSYFEQFSDKAQAGWLHNFMREINTTWPHPGHLMVNLAHPAATVESLAQTGCLEEYLPAEVDLLLIEAIHLTWKPTRPEALEDLLLRVYTHLRREGQCARPATVVFHTMQTKFEEAEKMARNGEGDAGPEAACAPGTFLDGRNFTHRIGHHLFGREMAFGQARDLRPHSEDLMEPFVKYYRAASISERNLLWGLLDSGLAGRMSVSECALLKQLYEDRTHPSNWFGQRLFTDLLLNYLRDAYDHLHARRDRAALAIYESSEHHQNNRQRKCPLWGRKPPVQNDYQGDLLNRCYGVDYNVVGNYGGETMTRLPAALQRKVLDTVKNRALDIVANQGWRFVKYQIHGKLKKFKPGWVATEAGAELQVRVNSSFARGRPQPSPTLVDLEYLLSYEHMGQANITCLSGCECSGIMPWDENTNYKFVDALYPDGQLQTTKASVPSIAKLWVSEADECLLSIKVLESTRSGEHKFKLGRITLINRQFA